MADLVALARAFIDRAGSRGAGDHQLKRRGWGCQAPGGCIHHYAHHANIGDRHRGTGRSGGDDLCSFIGAQEASRGQCEGTKYQHPGEQGHYIRIFQFGQTDPVDS